MDFFFSLSRELLSTRNVSLSWLYLHTDPLWDYSSNFKFMIIKPDSCDNPPSGTESSQHLMGGVQHLVGFNSHYSASWSTSLGTSKGTVPWTETSLAPSSPSAQSYLHHRLSTFAKSCINTPKSTLHRSGKGGKVLLPSLVHVGGNEKALRRVDMEILVPW